MIKKVLVLDDDPGILEVMQEALSYEGFEVKILEETDDIIALIHSYQPDVFITDFLLKGINGGELCKKIKTTTATSHTPVVIFSAYNKVLQSLGYYDCDAFIPKPFDLKELIDVVKNLSDNNLKTRINAKTIGY
ncbi:MAG: response regulator [Sphingobacteriaceae bacterium]|nr:MAG: response regulator [Sphingobacteriaceae bacterium]